jgi:ribokinase
VVVVTLGRAGAVCVGPDGSLRVAGRSVGIVDTTGAGDCFVGNLAAGLCAGRSTGEALEMANVAASLSVQTQGAAVSMPGAEAIRAAAFAAPTERTPGGAAG